MENCGRDLRKSKFILNRSPPPMFYLELKYFERFVSAGFLSYSVLCGMHYYVISLYQHATFIYPCVLDMYRCLISIPMVKSSYINGHIVYLTNTLNVGVVGGEIVMP